MALQSRMDKHFDRIRKLILSKQTSSHMRCLLRDVVELRENHWVPRRDENCNPKTIAQIHQEAHEQAKKQQLEKAERTQRCVLRWYEQRPSHGHVVRQSVIALSQLVHYRAFTFGKHFNYLVCVV